MRLRAVGDEAPPREIVPGQRKDRRFSRLYNSTFGAAATRKGAAKPGRRWGRFILATCLSSRSSALSALAPPRFGPNLLAEHCHRLPPSSDSTPARAARSTTTMTSSSPSFTSNVASSYPSHRCPNRFARPSSPPRTPASTHTTASTPWESLGPSTRTSGAVESSRAAAR